MKLYYEDDAVTIYHGDCRELVLSELVGVDTIVTDPPYGDTSLTWDRIAEGWVPIVTPYARSLWCFGSLRSWLATHDEFEDAGWRYAQEVVWEKHNGSSFHADRFKRVHELAVQWYQGRLGDDLQGRAGDAGRDRTDGQAQASAAAHGRHRSQCVRERGRRAEAHAQRPVRPVVSRLGGPSHTEAARHPSTADRLLVPAGVGSCSIASLALARRLSQLASSVAGPSASSLTRRSARSRRGASTKPRWTLVRHELRLLPRRREVPAGAGAQGRDADAL